MNISWNDTKLLYGIFCCQCLILLVCVPLLLMQCTSVQRRQGINKGYWFLKMKLLGLLLKWSVDTWDLIDTQLLSTTTNFDPYKILQIDNDGSFNTKEIKTAYTILAEKYRPDKVDTTKMSIDKARYRFERLKKAHQTLTR